jgi:outer membrane protein, multidrug efflux system
MTRAAGVTGALAAAALAAACAVGPDYERPEVTVPESFRAANASNGAPVDTQWWTLFGDPTLTALEAQARDANQDLKLAIARIDETRAGTRIARSELFPTVTLDPSYAIGQESGRRPFAPPVVANDRFQDWTLPLNLTYEIDLWGRVRRSVESAAATAHATENEAEFVALSVASDVATQYFALRSLDIQAAVLEESRQIFAEQLRVVDSKNRAGLVSELDVAQARTQLATTEAQQSDVARARAEAEHALAVLVGQPASDFSIAVEASSPNPPEVPAGVPSQLLEGRPDVAQAEQNLVSANAEIGVAKALFFPQVNLTGVAGFESTSLPTLVDWESKLWEVGPSIHVPLFEGGRLRANLSAAEARYAEQVANYRQTVLGAFRDVEDALVGVELRAKQGDSVAQAVESSGRAAAVSKAQYDRGIADYLQVVVAESTHLNLKLQAAQIQEQRLDSTVLLVRAIGGGWRPPAQP